MSIEQKEQRYDLLLKDFNALQEGEEQTIILEGRAYVVKPAEVNDIERVPAERVFWD